MFTHCARCGRPATEGAPCGTCGSATRRTFTERADARAFQADRAAHGDVHRQAANRTFLPRLLTLAGVLFVIVGVGLGTAGYRSGSPALYMEAVAPVATGVALLAVGRRLGQAT